MPSRSLLPLFLLLLAAPCLAEPPVQMAPAETRAAFLKVIDRPRVDLAAKEEPALPDAPNSGLVRLGFSYASDAADRVPGVLLKASAGTGRRPVVIVMHGTGGRKEAELPRLRQFAAKGFVAVAIDGRYHGDRAGGQQGTKAYTAAIAQAFADGKSRPLYYDTVWDISRLIDYLQTRDDVDPKRIGLMGISKGGIETWLTAAIDERVAVAVPCIGVQGFAYALERDLWRPRVDTVKAGFEAAAKQAGVTKPDAAFTRTFYDRVIPGIYDKFDGPAMLPLIAPRPLLVVNGDSDDKTPVEGVKLAAAAAAKAYAAAEVPDRFRLIVEPKTGHKVNDDAMDAIVAWFATWLKP
jgi:dienelactone hydrolase